VADLAAAILARDAKAALGHVAEAAEQGLQLGELLDQLVDYWRGLMLVLVAGDGARDLPGTSSLHAAIRKHAAATNLDTVLAGLDALTATKAKLRGSPHAQVLLEVAVVRLARMDELLSVAQLAQMVASPGSVPASAARVPAVDPSKKNFLASPNRFATNGLAPKSVIVPTGPVPQFSAVWERVLQEIGPMLRATLQTHATPAILGPNSLALRFPADYSSAYDAGATEEAVRRVLRTVTHQEWTVRVERQLAGPTATNLATTPPPRQDRTKDLLQLPLFKKAVEVLGAQLVRVDEGFNPTPPAPTTDEG
jgi:DNA polymerase-3 subunit gamma/tau